MATVQSQNALPDNVIRAATTDARRLLDLSGVQRAALFEALLKFVPITSSIDQEEAESLGGLVGVDAAAVESAIRLAYFLRGQNRSGTFNADAISEGLRRAFSEAELVGADKLLEELSPAAVALAKNFTRISKLERTMPTLVESVVACDLRCLPSEKPNDFDLAPMAIVRLELDGVDDAIFHCSPQSLNRLIKTLQDAAATLDALDKFAQQKS